MRRVLAALLALALLPGCARRGKGAEPAPPQSAEANAVDALVSQLRRVTDGGELTGMADEEERQREFVLHGHTLDDIPQQMDRFRLRYGAPIRSTTRTLKNIYQPEVMDTIFSLEYQKYTVSFYQRTQDKVDFWIGLEAHPSLACLWGLRVGSSLDEVWSILGRFDYVDPESRQACYLAEGQIVAFRYDAARVVSGITWNPEMP